MFSLASRVDPGVVIDLSLKRANAGAAYRDNFDAKKTYGGYWDPMGCYSYATGDGYFKRSATATKPDGGAIACVNQWSGNLLNWAVSSSLDGVRLALTGGDRVIDEPGRTVLQRAVLPEDFYRSGSFPDKTVTGNLDKLTPLVTAARDGLLATGTLHFGNCLDRFAVGPAGGGTCTEPGGTTYLARVEVCTPTEAAARSSLCASYPDGNYKPVGSIQRYAGRMKFSVFGYLPDDDPARYGGVMRAPMKHAGPKKIDATLDTVDNPRAEWDATTGVFKAGAAEGDGVVDAINRFGRNGAGQGVYSLFDPAGELYYESLRYLQGKAPTPNAVSDTDSARSRGDPIAASCQRNGILVIGDAETHYDRSLPGLSKGDSIGDFDRGFNSAAYEPDTAYWTGLVGAFENREALSFTHPSGKAGLTTSGNEGPRALNYKGGTPLTSANIAAIETGADKGSFGMAGLAYWAHTQKIRSDHPDLRVQTFAVDMGRGGESAIGQKQRGSAFYLAAKYGGFADTNDDGNPFRASGGGSEWAEGLDADNQPKPANYLLAGEPSQLTAAIRRAFLRAEASAGGISAGSAISSDTITNAGASLYVPQFDGRRWSGTLLSYRLGVDAASGAVHKSDKPDWDAGELLTGNPNATPPVAARDIAGRRIFTLSTAGVGTPFEWAALDDGLRGWLSATPYAVPETSDGLGADRLAYLRGDRRKEQSSPQGIFRVRDSIMGDVTNSNPVYVGAPSLASQGAGYDKFLAAHRGRPHAVYVGANDGMLHAFEARTGKEFFAYVPRIMFAKLGAYTSPDYVHQSHVDGTPAVGEARMANGAWKTVLVSGSGGGATGVFALDVTDPADFSADKVLWEFSGAYDNDMGRVTQAPRIMKFRTAAATKTEAATYGWFAVVPSGFNNANKEGRAAMFLLSLDKPAAEAWKLNANFYKIVLPRPADLTFVNALSTPGDYAATDGSTRLLYAGDTQGNLWKFDFTGNAPWSASNALGLNGRPLMVATAGSGADAKRQPITVAPEVGVGPAGGAIVLFGTGKFVSPEDLGRSSRGVQTIYGVYDNGMAIPAGEARTQLQPRKVSPSDGQASPPLAGDPFVYGAFDRKTNTRRGWYFDLPAGPEQGERLVFQPVLSDGQLFFNTLIPNASACSADGGGRSCAVNAMTGLSQGGSCTPSGIGMLGAPHLVQLGMAGFGATDAFGRRSETKRLGIVSIGARDARGGRAGGMSNAQPAGDGKMVQTGGRLNWREVVDYRGAKK
ncbi:pilus assembly protein [Variovorax sp. 770b2]|uniref:pilus assembly protein n=1 Tax=Variovorax sp. 770b2 TaxID=1566271 RepID=UPI0008DF134D|nr:PilC/PilY family type IV pilus protein [Variovorax sp. 770b2]SFP46057.1 type IV pilus assembly protein PilY1 [Variovorax sp. 770b2]